MAVQPLCHHHFNLAQVVMGWASDQLAALITSPPLLAFCHRLDEFLICICRWVLASLCHESCSGIVHLYFRGFRHTGGVLNRPLLSSYPYLCPLLSFCCASLHIILFHVTPACALMIPCTIVHYQTHLEAGSCCQLPL